MPSCMASHYSSDPSSRGLARLAQHQAAGDWPTPHGRNSSSRGGLPLALPESASRGRVSGWFLRAGGSTSGFSTRGDHSLLLCVGVICSWLDIGRPWDGPLLPLARLQESLLEGGLPFDQPEENIGESLPSPADSPPTMSRRKH